MAQRPLVNVYLEDGWLVAKALKNGSLPVTAVYWSFIDQYERWEFHIATPLYDELGPKAAYEQVRLVFNDIEDLDTLSFTDIYLTSPDDISFQAVEQLHRRHAANYTAKDYKRRFFIYDTGGHSLYWYNLERIDD